MADGEGVSTLGRASAAGTALEAQRKNAPIVTRHDDGERAPLLASTSGLPNAFTPARYSPDAYSSTTNVYSSGPRHPSLLVARSASPDVRTASPVSPPKPFAGAEADLTARKRRSRDGGEGSTRIKKQLTPLKIRQKGLRKAPSLAHLPPTPMTAYFDAESHEEEQQGETRNHTAATPLASFAPLESHYSQAPILATSPALSSESISADEMGTDGSAGGLSISSEADTPGPITPATPAWKPRELTLLQSKKGFDLSAEPSHRPERERALVGLGVQTPSLSSLSEDGRVSRRTSRVLVKDIFPIASTSHAKTTSSPGSNSSSGPRELKLASSGGPPSSMRAKGNSSLASSPIAGPSSIGVLGQASKSPLPVLPPGPAFSVGSRLTPSISSNASSRRSSTSMSRLNGSSEWQTIDEGFQDVTIVPDRVLDELTPINGSRSGSPHSAPSPVSFAGQLALGSKRRGPPAPLILAHSPASSYSHDSGLGSAPTSNNSPLPTPHSSRFAEQVHDGLLGIPHASSSVKERGDIPPSPMSPYGGQAFHTPMQSPLLLARSESSKREKEEQVGDDERSEVREMEEIASSSREREWPPTVKDDVAKQMTAGLPTSHHRSSSNVATATQTASMPSSADDPAEERDADIRSRSVSSDDAVLERQAPSPLPALAFNTAIFTSPPTQSMASEQQSIAPDTLPEVLPAMPLRTTSKEKRASSSRRQSQSPMGPPPSVPLPTPPMPSAAASATRSPSTKSVEDTKRRLSSRSKGNGASTGEAALAVHSDQGSDGHRGSRKVDKPLPFLQKSKASLVPDVPSFGYTGPISSAEVADTSSPALGTGQYSPFLNDEPQFTSRWSSGSESEGDRPSRANSKKVTKQRKSFSGASASSSKKNSIQGSLPGASAPSKKGSFFAGLGLRKKSVPSLSHWMSSGQPTPTTTASDSPAPGKLDGLVEFPFPSTTTSQRESLVSSSRRGSSSPMPPAGVNSASKDADGRAGSRQSQSQSKGAGGVAMAARLSQGSGKKLTARRSDASIRTTASMQGAVNSATARLSAASISPAAQSPVLERRPAAPWEEGADAHGLGIQMPLQEESSVDVTLRETYEALRQSMRTAKSSESLKKQARASHRNSQESAHPTPVAPREKGDEVGIIQRRSGQFKARKRSLTLEGLSRRSSEAQPKGSRPPSAVISPSRAFASPTESNFSSIGSPDETPRIAYRALSGQQSVYSDNPKLTRKIERKGTVEDEESLVALGNAFISTLGVSTPPASTPTLLTSQATSSQSRNVRVTRVSARPRYPSLTDVGRQWVEEHPSIAFSGAQGEALLYNALSSNQTSGGRVIQTTTFSDESDSSTDDYGSSDGAGKQGSGGAGLGGESGRGDDGSQDEDKRARGVKAGGEFEESSSSDSDDSYGESDRDAGLDKTSMDAPSSSSDDVPLGQRVQNPKELQRQLRRTQGKASKRPPLAAPAAAPAEVPSSKLFFVLDAGELSARLLRIQKDREAVQDRAREMPPPTRSVSLSRTRSTTSRKPPTGSQARPKLPPIATRSATMPLSESNQSSDQVLSRAGPAALSPTGRLPQVPTSSGALSESTDGTTVTARDASGDVGYSVGHGEEYRSNVVAEFANTIRARSRSRSFAQPFSPPLDTNRPAMPVRPLAHQQTGRDFAVPAMPSESHAPRSAGAKSSGNNVSIPSPHEPLGGRTVKSSSSVEDNEMSGRARANTSAGVGSPMVQHRIYLLSKQRQGIAEVGVNARARDAVFSIMEREPMPADSRAGGWVLYDVCADLGIGECMGEATRVRRCD